MLTYLNQLMAPKRDETGVTALEYGLIAALIGMVILAAVSSLGTNLSAMFSGIAGRVTAAGS